MRRIACLLMVFLVFSPSAYAGEKIIGTACSGDQNAADYDTIAQCNSGTFIKAPIFLGPATGYTCNSGNAGLQRYNASSKIMEFCDGTNWLAVSSSVSAGCSGPSAFSFTNATSQSLATLVYSNTITPSGCSQTMAVSVSGGGSPQISINGGAWATTGSIASGQTIQVRLVSSGTVSTTLSASVVIGSTTGTTWTVTTRSGSLMMFATSATYIANLGGLSGADTYCQNQAVSLGYSGVYKSLLSDESTNAKDRVTLSYPIVRASNGTTVIAASNLFSGTLSNSIGTAGGQVWTGTNPDGTKASGATCSSWSSTSGSSTTGLDTATNGASSNPRYGPWSWIQNHGGYSDSGCSSSHELYCVQQ